MDKVAQEVFVMDNLFLLLSFVGLVGGVIWLVVNLFRRRPKKKPVLLFVSGIVFFFLFGLTTTPPEKKPAEPAPAVAETSAPAAQEEKAAAAKEETAAPAKTPKEALTEICRANISNGDELVDVEVNEDMSKENYGKGKLIVLPKFKSQSGFRSSELMKVCKMMKAIYDAGYPVSEVTIFTQDMSGMTIMKSTLDEKKAKQIDWSTVTYADFDKQLSKFWAVPDLRNK